LSICKIITPIKWLIENNFYWRAPKQTYKDILDSIKPHLVVNHAKRIHLADPIISANNVELDKSFHYSIQMGQYQL
jgi:hypothetical protein